MFSLFHKQHALIDVFQLVESILLVKALAGTTLMTVLSKDYYNEYCNLFR